ncbi:MAG TPA: ThiF family adenylyltransferase [Ignavibacteria bacterium]|nr:ThiF family adenylyltransferase [Ignavibacteria bacterium]
MSEITSITEDIYKRQLNFADFPKKSAMVIGLGGVGSWLALDLALIGIGTLILIDPDNIEASNLNRTFFRLSDINRKKTEVIEEQINERRPDTIIITINDYFNSSHLNKYEVDYIFDCTDNLATRRIIEDLRNKVSLGLEEIDKIPFNLPDNEEGTIYRIPGAPSMTMTDEEYRNIPNNKHRTPAELHVIEMNKLHIPYCKCGYDGVFGTILINEFNRGRWGEDGCYSIVSSLFATPQMLAAMAVIEMLLVDCNQNICINFNIKHLLKNYKGDKQ